MVLEVNDHAGTADDVDPDFQYRVTIDVVLDGVGKTYHFVSEPIVSESTLLYATRTASALKFPFVSVSDLQDTHLNT